MASQSLERLGLTSAVAAPKDLLLENLNSTLKSYLLVTLAVALLFPDGSLYYFPGSHPPH